MTMELAILIAILAEIIVFGIVVTVIFLKVLTTTSEAIKKIQILKEREFLYSIDTSEEENFKMLDSLIEDSLSRYRISYLEYNDELYISEEDQNKMITWIMRDILSNMSPVYYDRLKYIYNKSKLEDVIYNKVTMAVLGYTISINGNMKE